MNIKEKSDHYWLLLALLGFVPAVHNNTMLKRRKLTWNERQHKKLGSNALERLGREWLSSHPAFLYRYSTSHFPWKIPWQQYLKGFTTSLLQSTAIPVSLASSQRPYLILAPDFLSHWMLWIWHAAIHLKYHYGVYLLTCFSLSPPPDTFWTDLLSSVLSYICLALP